MEKENKEKRTNPKGANKEFPLTTLGVAEEVLLAVEKAGGKIDTRALSETLGLKGGAFARKLSAIKRYNLVSGQGTLVVSDIGKRIVHPMSDEELAKSRKEAFLSVPLFSELYERFVLNLPEDKSFVAILVREHKVKETDAKTILNIYKNSIKEFLSIVPENVPVVEQNKVSKKTQFFENSQKKAGEVTIHISSPMGENSFKADNKAELEALKKKIEKLFALIEDELPNNQPSPTAEEKDADLSSSSSSG